MNVAQPEGQNQQQGQILAEPFARIFVDWAEADWAFDLLRETIRRLRVTSPYDQRLAVTLLERAGKPLLHLDFGGWLVLGFRGPGLTAGRVELALLAGETAWDERLAALPFERKEGTPEVRGYELPIEVARPLTSNLRRAYEATLDFIADKFQSWKKATHWKQHNPEIVEACFDLEKRELLFSGGLAEPELRYERYYTAFHHELAEEEGVYEVEQETGDEETRGWEMEELKEELPVFDHSLNEVDAVETYEDEELELEVRNLPIPQSPNLPISLSQLLEDTGLDEATLTRWLRAIERKKQVILYGPPGTGKTYLAEKLAQYLVSGADGFFEIVQFHPAYAYEDFIQGLRPRPGPQGSLTYQLVPGRFLEFCHKARQRRGRCVLIIDEINRANLARVFGELMYLLEYRERTIPLAGGGELFHIPGNVYLIATMNTADRSIALVDHALRRRFAFLALKPDYELLRRYHQRRQTGFPVENLIKILTRLNQHIGDPHYEVGVTFFLYDKLADELEDIWRMEIEPYLEEYFFDRPDSVESFRWDKLKQGLEAG
jgi:MoxR-like ATPase